MNNDMPEKIIRIEEASFGFDGRCNAFDGYLIITDKQTIRLGVSNEQACCERIGYFSTPDEIASFIGSTLLEMKITDICLNPHKLDAEMYEGGAMFVDIVTDRGVLQFTVYNAHNGYYGHEAVAVSRQLNHAQTI